MGSTSLFSLFTMTIQLTETGFNQLDDVLDAIFGYIKLLKSNGPKESIFRELQTISETNFRFSPEQNPFNNVQRLVHNLKHYPPKYALSGDKLLFEYDANEIQKMIDVLSTRKFNIMITSTKRYDETVTYELKEQWFGTSYSEIDMPAKWITLWENAIPNSEFSLPDPNPFIADDFTIYYNHEYPIPKCPNKILDNDLCELWFRQDDTFLLPDARYIFYFRTSILKQSIKK